MILAETAANGCTSSSPSSQIILFDLEFVLTQLCKWLQLTWIATNTPNFTHRATLSAFVNVFAQAISVGVLQAFNDPPFYKKGLTIVLCFVAFVPVAALTASWYARRFNARKPAPETVPIEERRKTLEELGVNHPEFFLEP
jgi:hypothetical protein